MFTGIIEEIGTVHALNQSGSSWKLEITAQRSLQDLAVGDSISINGACHTVTKLNPDSFHVDVTPETRRVSTLGRFNINKKVNLEKALTLTKPLGGHLVQGHVDSVGKINAIRKQGNAAVFEIQFPAAFRKYVAVKGSICIDGISLTIAGCTQNSLTISVIPHTVRETTLQFNKVSDQVNLEFDIIAKYVESLSCFGESKAEKSELSLTYLKNRGF
ncbi:MAG: riboflavin synthase [Spirochaetales bacterium]|nr:riboflavin synthase [Spirochaetales bacterium]